MLASVMPSVAALNRRVRCSAWMFSRRASSARRSSSIRDVIAAMLSAGHGATVLADHGDPDGAHARDQRLAVVGVAAAAALLHQAGERLGVEPRVAVELRRVRVDGALDLLVREPGQQHEAARAHAERRRSPTRRVSVLIGKAPLARSTQIASVAARTER
jgi:hypothetical protein